MLSTVLDHREGLKSADAPLSALTAGSEVLRHQRPRLCLSLLPDFEVSGLAVWERETEKWWGVGVGSPGALPRRV